MHNEETIHLNITKGGSCLIHIGTATSERALCGEVVSERSHGKFRYTTKPINCNHCLAKLDAECLTHGVEWSPSEIPLVELSQYVAKYGRR